MSYIAYRSTIVMIIVVVLLLTICSLQEVQKNASGNHSLYHPIITPLNHTVYIQLQSHSPRRYLRLTADKLATSRPLPFLN